MANGAAKVQVGTLPDLRSGRIPLDNIGGESSAAVEKRQDDRPTLFDLVDEPVALYDELSYVLVGDLRHDTSRAGKQSQGSCSGARFTD